MMRNSKYCYTVEGHVRLTLWQYEMQQYQDFKHAVNLLFTSFSFFNNSRCWEIFFWRQAEFFIFFALLRDFLSHVVLIQNFFFVLKERIKGCQVMHTQMCQSRVTTYTNSQKRGKLSRSSCCSARPDNSRK